MDRVHYILTPPLQMYVSESLRDLADKIDHGSGDKLQFRLARRKLELIRMHGPFNRPWFKLR